jgi:hypothetical protein
MRRRIYILGAVVLGLCVLLVLFRPAKKEPPDASTAQEVATDQLLPLARAKTLEKSKASKQQKNANAPVASNVPPRRSATEISNTLYQQMQADWRKPIEFYGIVVDENSNAVAGAGIRFRWADETENVNVSTAQTDSEGLFSLHGRFGRSLHVWVSKEGYYASHGGEENFLYSLANEKELYSADPLNPVVFRLQKKGEGVDLITSENGMQLKVAVRVPRDNSLVQLDFFQKQASPLGQLEIRQFKPAWQQATNWSFSLGIPSGGLIENQDEFQFEAPDTNYQPSVECHFAKGETNWTTQVTKQFYIRFGEPPKYGWLRIESNLGQETVFITYAVNPNGTRNLEPK